MFLTDDMSTGFDHIWVVVHKVEVQAASGAFVTAFDDPSGVNVDVTNLSDGAERFLFIGARNVPVGDYTGVRITMDTDLTVFATGSSTGEACVFDPSLDIGGGLSAATFAFAAPVTIGTGSHVV
ncbi:MAG TPA: DUF4382 domain-containing protein, partial [Fimbriimonadaceae bacterium]|nr:DUF4382 domain-containing protein [Fimbriimonadaceae bacterium]